MPLQTCHSERSEESPAWMHLAGKRFVGVCSGLARSKNTSTCPAFAVTTPSPGFPKAIILRARILELGRELAAQGLPSEQIIVGADGPSGKFQRDPNLPAAWNLTIIESISSHYGNVPRGTSSALLPRTACHPGTSAAFVIDDPLAAE